MKFLISILLLLSLLTGLGSCNTKRKREYFGSVVTRHNNPVPNAKLSFRAIETSAINGKTTGGNYYQAYTDGAGKFRAEFRMYRKEHVHELTVSSDSGSFTFSGVPSGVEQKFVLP